MEVTSLFWLMYPLMYPLVIENCNWTSTINGALWRLITGGYVQTSKNIFHTQVSENTRTPKSSIYIWCSIINHPATGVWGSIIYGNLFFCPNIFHILPGNSHHSSNIVRAALPEHRPLLTCPTAKRYLEQIPGPGPPPYEKGGTLGNRFTQFLIFVFRVCRVDLSIFK